MPKQDTTKSVHYNYVTYDQNSGTDLLKVKGFRIQTFFSNSLYKRDFDQRNKRIVFSPDISPLICIVPKHRHGQGKKLSSSVKNFLNGNYGKYTITLTLFDETGETEYDKIVFPPLEYSVTAGKPVASASDISGQPKSMEANVVYSVTAKYSDPDGRSNLKDCYLRLDHPSKPLTMMWHEPGDW